MKGVTLVHIMFIVSHYGESRGVWSYSVKSREDKNRHCEQPSLLSPGSNSGDGATHSRERSTASVKIIKVIPYRPALGPPCFRESLIILSLQVSPKLYQIDS